MDGGPDDPEHFPDDLPEQQALQVDQGLTPLQAVMEWAAEGNPPAQRVAYILSIPAAAAESSLEEARAVLLPLLSQLAFDDHPDVKQATAEVLGPLGPILASKDAEAGEAEGSADAMDLLVLAHRLLQDPERGIQESAASSVAMFAGLLSHEHRREHLTAVVDALMQDYEDEQMQECAVDLLTKVAAAAGGAHPGWCEECALPRVLKLALHRDYNIRVHSVGALVQLAACLPQEERSNELLSAFIELGGDPVWSVRQDCASELAALAQQLPREAVRERLLPLWEALSGDVSAWVQAAARRQAGPLLASIHPDDCSDALIVAFVAAAVGPATLMEACAHFLPAVVRSLGVQRWHQLREVPGELAASEYVSVRAALAESMHQLAAMLGLELTESDLLPVIQVLSQDPEQVVRDALTLNIRALLAALPPGPARLAQLGFLSRMHPEDGSSCGQWRMRLLIAEQLAGIAAMLQQQGLAEVLLPATLRLCEDPVAAVRDAAAAQLGCMVGALLMQASSAGGSGGQEEEQEADEDQQQQEQQHQQQGTAPSPAGEQKAEAAPATTAAGPAASEDTAATAVADVEPGEAAPAPPSTPPLPPAAAAEASAEQDAEPSEAAAAAAAAPLADQQHLQQPQQEPPAQQPQPEPQRLAASPAAAVGMVQQIAQHMVELQRSSCHRARQTYLAFCTALLLPPSGEAAQAAPAAAAAAAAVWPALAQSVASSGTVQGLLEGALALAADPVPNVRLGVARLLAALRRQQPLLAAGSPKVAAALGSLVADSDRDVQQAAAVAAAAAMAE